MKIKNEEEEAKKQREINIENLNNLKKEIEEKNKKEEKLENDNEGIFGIEEYNLELENSSKRRKILDIPYESDSKEVVTCGCNIF